MKTGDYLWEHEQLYNGYTVEEKSCLKGTSNYLKESWDSLFAHPWWSSECPNLVNVLCRLNLNCIEFMHCQWPFQVKKIFWWWTHPYLPVFAFFYPSFCIGVFYKTSNMTGLHCYYNIYINVDLQVALHKQMYFAILVT